MPLFECRGVARKPWFDGFSLALEAGEIAVLSGPSGSGKTLLLRALADLDPFDGGEVALHGRRSADFAPAAWRRQVMYLHQDPVRLPGSVRDNLACVERLQAQREKRITPPPDLDPATEAARLSGGEAQRLALHRALAVEPEVLLLDEASSALDADSAGRFEAQVREWAQAGHAALWVAHDSGLAERLGARVVRFP